MRGATVTWGDVYVTVFFIISGALLRYNNPEIQDISRFYKKRFMAIFSPYYIAWGCMYILSAIKNRSVFYKGNPISILLSLIGMDSYLSYKINGYYILGEWFVGAIVLLYLVYPIVVFWNKKSKLLSCSVIGIMYIASLAFNITGMSSFRTLPSCLLSFYIGYLMVEYYNYMNRFIFGLMIMVLLGIAFLKMNLPNIEAHIIGGAVALILYGIGTNIMHEGFLTRIVMWISKRSYYIFLIHHVVICQMIKKFGNVQATKEKVAILIITLFVIIFFTEMLKKATSRVLTLLNQVKLGRKETI